MSALEEDFLSVDTPIPGQNYVCLSFVSPEKLIRNKELYFVKSFLNDILGNEDKVEFLLRQKSLSYAQVDDLYESFKIREGKSVSDKYNEENEFQTSMRTLKVRGVYDTEKEAKFRAKQLQSRDKNFNVFVGQVGYWLPWDPNPSEVKTQEYANNKLNELMKKYNENKAHRDVVFDRETKERIEKAREFSNKEKTDAEMEADKEGIDHAREVAKAKEDMLSGAPVPTPLTTSTQSENIKDIDDDPLGSNSGHADPWMARKAEESASAEVVEEVVSTEVEEVETTEVEELETTEVENTD